MGHANLSNLSDLFVNLLYAKGRLTIAAAIETAVRRNETVHASEGQYHDEEMLGLGFMDIIQLLTSTDGKGYSGDNSGKWEGPWVVADWDVCKVPKSITPTDRINNLLKQCRKVSLGYIPMCPVWEERMLFEVCADAIQDEGHDQWSALVRRFPKCFRAWAMWHSGDEDYHNGDYWEDFDHIRWVFAPTWRNRYKDVPRLENVTH